MVWLFSALSAFDTLGARLVLYAYRTYVCMFFSLFQLYYISSVPHDLEDQNTIPVDMTSSKKLYLPLNQDPLSDARDDGQEQLDRHAWVLKSSIFSKSNLIILVLALSNLGFLWLQLYEMKARQTPPGYGILSSTTLPAFMVNLSSS